MHNSTMHVMIADIQISMIEMCAKECIEYYLSLVINTNTLFAFWNFYHRCCSKNIIILYSWRSKHIINIMHARLWSISSSSHPSSLSSVKGMSWSFLLLHVHILLLSLTSTMVATISTCIQYTKSSPSILNMEVYMHNSMSIIASIYNVYSLLDSVFQWKWNYKS